MFNPVEENLIIIDKEDKLEEPENQIILALLMMLNGKIN